MKKRVMVGVAAALLAASPSVPAEAQTGGNLKTMSIGDVGSIRGSYSYSLTRNTVTVRMTVKDNVRGNARTFAKITGWRNGIRSHFHQVYATPKLDGTSRTYTWTGPLSGNTWRTRSWMVNLCRERSHATDPCVTQFVTTD